MQIDLNDFRLTRKSRNLVRFARHLPIETMDESFAGDFAFRDAGSRFSVLKSPKTAPGPDECFGLFARDVRTLFRKLLGLKVLYVGLDPKRQSGICGYNSMNYYRSHIVESFCDNGIEPMPPIEGECFFWFAATDVLCICYRLVNKSATDVPVQLSWDSVGELGEGCRGESVAEGFRFENIQSVGKIRYVSRAELIANTSDIRFQTDKSNQSSVPVERIIRARDSIECRFAVRFAFNDELFPEWPVDLWSDASLSRAIAATETAYAILPELPETSRGHADLVLKAAGTLRSLRYKDRDASGHPFMTIHAGKTGCGATWFWDTGVTLPALGLMQSHETGHGALRLLTGGVRDDGMPAVTYENQKYAYYGYQMPLLAWGAGHYLATSPDNLLLAEIYGPLSRYVRHWLDKFRPVWGLAVHPDGCSCLDDALRWHSGSPLEPQQGQPWHAQQWGKMTPTAFVAPDINAFLVLECRTLAVMADALGKPEEAIIWRTQVDELAAAINEYLLDPVTRTYQDRNYKTGVFNGIVSLASFIPIYAGIAPPDVTEHLCRDYLLSPAHFLTEMPFPTIDRAHSTFRSGGFLHAHPEHPGSLVQHSYWRGRTWLHGNIWYLGALCQGGFQREADEIADRILSTVGRSESINECYDSLTGFGNGHPEFMWSSAAVLALAYQCYKLDPVGAIKSGRKRV